MEARIVLTLSLLLAAGNLAFSQRPMGNGLKGEYFNGPNFEQKAFTRTDAQVSFDWNWQYPAPGVQREYFSVRWTGKLYAPTSGKYRFSATVDDGVRVWVGGRKVIDEWRKQDDSQFVGEITLEAKKFYDLKIEYYNDWKGSIIFVYWESPDDRKFSLFGYNDVPRKTIPTQYLFSKPVAPTAANTPPRVVPTAAVASKAMTPAPKQVAAVRPKLTTPTTKAKVNSTSPKPMKQLAVAAPTPKAPEVFSNLVSGEAVVLRNVFFEQSQYRLLPDSYAELDKLVNTMRKSPNLRIEIGGHTDNVGDPRLNIALSENRAKVVANYLTRHGIADERIDTKGYGGSQPVTDNTTEAQRAKNRRVEFVVK